MMTFPFSLLLGILCNWCAGSSVNVALNKTTRMSSGSPDQSALAVDGNTSTTWPNVITTKAAGFSWWRVDLQTAVMHAVVSIYFRTDSTLRRNGVQLYTSEDPTAFLERFCDIITGSPDGADIPDVINKTCAETWRYLTIYTDTDNGDGPDLDFAEVQVISSSVNVAVHKPAIMSSGLPSIAERAVDGDMRTTWPHVIDTSKTDNSSWWNVDLSVSVTDAICVVYFRTDYTYRRNGVRVYTSNSPNQLGELGELCYVVRGRPDGSDIPDVVRPLCPGQWRHLTIYTETDNGDGPYLDFGEVQVLDCVGEMYGEDCNKSCSVRMCRITATTCHRLTGVCPPGGCMEGWQDQDCAKEFVSTNETRQIPEARCSHLSVEVIALIGGAIGVVAILSVGVGICLFVRYRRLRKGSPIVEHETSESLSIVEYCKTTAETSPKVYDPRTPAHINSYSALGGDTRMTGSDVQDYDFIQGTEQF